MPSRFFTLILLSLVALLSAAIPAHAQQTPLPTPPQNTPEPPTTAAFDPSDVYLQAYLAVKDAEIAQKSKNFLDAIEKYQRAQTLLLTIKRYYPTWRNDMLNGRLTLTQKAITEIQPKAQELQKQKNALLTELNAGELNHKPITPTQPSPPPITTTPDDQSKLNKAETEIARLRNLLANTNQTPNSRDTSRIEDITAQRNLLSSQLQNAQNELAALRARLASAPVTTELNQLNQRIDSLEKERSAMAQALTQSRQQEINARAQIATLQADLQLSNKKAATLERDLKLQTKTSADVVSGQLTQLKELQTQLQQKDLQLNTAKNRISQLETALQQSTDAFQQIQNERDKLLTERDQMAALLKLNDSSRIQTLIDQNMNLAKQLREASERADLLYQDNNTAKDDLTDALRDLAIAKSQINQFQREKQKQDQRLTDLEARLKSEAANLGKNQNPEEVNALREIIKKQLLVQQRRQQARELLVETVKNLGQQNPTMSKAVAMLDGAEIPLSEKEKQLIAGAPISAEIYSPAAAKRANPQPLPNSQSPITDFDSYEQAAQKAFTAGRFASARELYQMIIDSQPNNSPAINKLGVVQLREKDLPAATQSFLRACEINPENPYSHTMLGYTYFQANNPNEAKKQLNQAIALSPNNARARILLGNLLFEENHLDQAKSQFTAAISADPLLSEPYYNLSVIATQQKQWQEARHQYDLALERGALPDPQLKQEIDTNLPPDEDHEILNKTIKQP